DAEIETCDDVLVGKAQVHLFEHYQTHGLSNLRYSRKSGPPHVTIAAPRPKRVGGLVHHSFSSTMAPREWRTHVASDAWDLAQCARGRERIDWDGNLQDPCQGSPPRRFARSIPPCVGGRGRDRSLWRAFPR